MSEFLRAEVDRLTGRVASLVAERDILLAQADYIAALREEISWIAPLRLAANKLLLVTHSFQHDPAFDFVPELIAKHLANARSEVESAILMGPASQ